MFLQIKEPYNLLECGQVWVLIIYDKRGEVQARRLRFTVNRVQAEHIHRQSSARVEVYQTPPQ